MKKSDSTYWLIHHQLWPVLTKGQPVKPHGHVINRAKKGMATVVELLRHGTILNQLYCTNCTYDFGFMIRLLPASVRSFSLTWLFCKAGCLYLLRRNGWFAPDGWPRSINSFIESSSGSRSNRITNSGRSPGPSSMVASGKRGFFSYLDIVSVLPASSGSVSSLSKKFHLLSYP